jgi:DnaJ-domain-containing protein 1
MPYLRDEAQHWRERAEHMIGLADLANDQIAKETMLSIAAGYENLAARAEERLWAPSARTLRLVRQLPPLASHLKKTVLEH